MTLVLLFMVYACALSYALSRAGHRAAGSTSATAATHAAPPARILIIGATGGTGSEVLKLALERGYDVTVLVRDPARLRDGPAGLTVLRGDVMDPAAVDAAVRGQDAVVSALGHTQFLGPSRILSEGTRNLVHAMQAHGVRRLVCETSLGIGDSAGRMGVYYTLFTIPVILPFYYWDKTRQERIVAASDLDWVIVRPAALTNAAKRGVRRAGAGVGGLLLTHGIPRADVAEFMLDQLTSDTYLRQAPGLE